MTITEEQIEKVKDQLGDTLTEHLKDMVIECNSWNGSLDWLEYYENDEEFFNTFFTDPMESARAVCYGDYNFTDEYVHFNAYGNLESCNEWEYEQELKDYTEEIIETYLDNIDNMYDDNTKKIILNIINE